MDTMNEVETKIEINGVYKTHVGDLVKIMEIDKANDRIHLYNISDGANQWVSLSRALEHKIKARVR
jgi:mRNA-degrading endonuclease RelE of RelBE toxin-antitoxin system